VALTGEISRIQALWILSQSLVHVLLERFDMLPKSVEVTPGSH
jgi:hypothetical protein